MSHVKIGWGGAFLFFCLVTLTLMPAACGGGVSSEHAARQAYMGLDHAVDRALKLAMRGYNAATSAHIPDQSEPGDESGTMVVGGKVDAGESANKVITVTVALDEYSDGVLEDEDGDDLFIFYFTEETEEEEGILPVLDLKLKGMPDGTFDGTLEGHFLMEGDLDGRVTLDLQIEGVLEEVAGSDGEIRRKPGTVTVIGTATSRYGEFEVSIQL